MKNIYRVLCLGACMLPGMLFAQKPEVTVKKASAAISIDGVGTDAAWANAPKIAIDKPYTGETVVGGDATFQMLYDADNLYVFVNVTDDVVTLDNTADWKGDKFELYLGLPGYVPGTGAGDNHARQFVGNASQTWFDDVTKLTHPDWYDAALWPGVKNRATDGVTFAYNETVSGYAYEFKINKSALEDVDLATIDSLGFDFCLADNDVIGDGKGVRNRKMFYNTGDKQYANENWGAMDLATLKFEQAPVNSKPVVTVQPTSSAISVDGVGTDAAWANAPKIAIDKPYTGETVVGGDATFQMLYDADNLYVFVNVTDDVVTLDNTADWKGDKFELYLGLPGYVPGTGAGDSHARQFYGNASQTWFDDVTKLTHPDWYDAALWPGVKNRATDGVTFAYNETVSGYAYEFKINKSALEDVDFAKIDSIGFDFTLADNDVVGDGKGVRNRKVFYNTGDKQYANENWGAMDLATLKFAPKAPFVPSGDKPVVSVKKASSALNIDGVANESVWTAAPKHDIDKPYTGETVVGGDATFQMLYDADNLYVFVNVTDDVVTLDNTADWKGDKFELYLGLPGYVPGTGAGDNHARQFFGNASQTWFDDATKLTHANWYGEELWPGGTARATDGVTFAYNETVTGYAYEFKINKSALENVDLATIDSLAFDFTLADNDVVGDGKGVRNRKVFYNTGNLKYANENWGAMDLATLIFDKSTYAADPFKTTDQVAYISHDILKFKGFDQAVDAEIYSILGQKMLIAKNVNEVNVSNLKNGIYIVRVGNQSFKVIK
jgi:hypothetical protein